MPSAKTTAATPAAQEHAARQARSRLRSWSREIERISAGARYASHLPSGARLRALRNEAARLGAELRQWDVSSQRRIEQLDRRLDRLGAEIRLTAALSPYRAQMLAQLGRTQRALRHLGPTEDIEISVYNHLYPRLSS